MEKSFELEDGFHTKVTYRNDHRGIYYEISEHSFKNEELKRMAPLLPDSVFNTYVYLSPELHDIFKHRISDAPWNGGPTFYQMETFKDIVGYYKDREPKVLYRIGDDFAHSWDAERYGSYNLGYMKRHICSVIDFLLDGEDGAPE